MQLKEVTNIYIIESPTAVDLENNRKEGLALSETLKLAGINNQYLQVNDLKSFSECFDGIVSTEANYKKNNKFRVITIHFSMHGNEDGVELSDGHFIDWSQLYYQYLKKLINVIEYRKTKEGNLVAPLHIHLSTCKGYFAKEMKDIEVNSPYLTLVGPTLEVNWSDSLIAFVTFYHNTIHKQNGPRIAAQKMNSAADIEDVFQIDLAKNFNYTK